MKRLSRQQKEFLLGELVGERVRIAFAADKGLVGLEGKIADETMNTLVLHTEKGLRRVPKNSCKFAFPDAGIEIEGAVLAHRPHERTKKLGQKL